MPASSPLSLLSQYRRFAQGWILHEEGLSVPSKSQRVTKDWSTQRIGKYVLKFETSAKHHCGRSGASEVHALGILMNVFDFGLGEVEICTSLAHKIESEGWASFYHYLKGLAGTHIIFVKQQGLSVILDATGTVPAVHGQSGGSTIVASHPRLIAQITGAPISSVADEWSRHPNIGAGGRYMPGLLTEFDGIEIITPNQRFDVETRDMHRFYPGGPLAELPPEEIAAQLQPLLTGQLNSLSRHSKLAFSLSGGLDTRVTLATSQPVSKKSLYFTYYMKDSTILSADRRVATQIGEKFNLSIKFFPWKT